jgi:hypothetical protein
MNLGKVVLLLHYVVIDVKELMSCHSIIDVLIDGLCCHRCN